MTLTEIIEKFNDKLLEQEVDFNTIKQIEPILRQACLDYAKGIVPEELPLDDYRNEYAEAWNDCRSQILEQIKRDS